MDKENGFEWIGEYDINAGDLLSGNNRGQKIKEAKEFLLDILADGAVEQNVILKESERRGIKGKTFCNAKTTPFRRSRADKRRTADVGMACGMGGKHSGKCGICNENIKDVYHALFDEALSRYNEKQTRNDRRIDDYYEKIRPGKQEKTFHEIILQIGDRETMGRKQKKDGWRQRYWTNICRIFREEILH